MTIVRHKHTWAKVPWSTVCILLPFGYQIRWTRRTCTDKDCGSHWTDMHEANGYDH